MVHTVLLPLYQWHCKSEKAGNTLVTLITSPVVFKMFYNVISVSTPCLLMCVTSSWLTMESSQSELLPSPSKLSLTLARPTCGYPLSTVAARPVVSTVDVKT